MMQLRNFESMTVTPLPDGPPSDGAHRMAWWIGAAPDAEFAIGALAWACDAPPSLIDRLLSGDTVPEDMIAAKIAVETGGDVLPEDWARGGPVNWLDRPAPRATGSAACR